MPKAIVLIGLCYLLTLLPHTLCLPRPRTTHDERRAKRQALGGNLGNQGNLGNLGLDLGLSVLPWGPEPEPGPFPFDPIVEGPWQLDPVRDDDWACLHVVCPNPGEIMIAPHREARRADVDARIPRCCRPSTPQCPTCRNGGTRFGQTCHCQMGFRGLCCETQEMCTQPPVPVHGSLSPNKFIYAYGEVVTYSCDTGYRLNGDTASLCQGIRAWSGATPTCTAITCSSPGTLANGHVTPSGTRHAYGTVATFRCNAGYRLQGGATRTCSGLGAWTGSVPQCQMISCSQLAAPVHGSIQVSATTYGSVASYSCRDGFQLSGSQTRTCQADGSWSGGQPTCTIRRCPTMAAPSHGVILSSSVDAGSHVNFQCIPGYRLVGNERITCRLDGTWSGQPPTCQICPRNQYKGGTNALTSCSSCPSHSHTTTSGNTDRRYCVCDDNYRGPNGGPCQLIQCSMLPTPPHAVIGSCSTAYRGQCHFSCSPGHVRTSGDSVRTCGVSASWSGTDIVCTACEADTYSVDGQHCTRCPLNSHTEGPGLGPQSCVCETGFTKNAQQQCEDINECSTGNGGCDQTCENHVGSYQCRCTDLGFVPDEDDFRRCVPANQCPLLPAPTNGGYVCVMQRRTNTQRCQLKCDRGYEHVLRPNTYEECGPTTQWRWSYDLIGDDILPCREELFPGLVFDSEIFFFVADCASLTAAELAAVKEAFLAYLVASGLCTEAGVMACSIVDVWVECEAHQTTPSSTGPQSLQRLRVNVRLGVSGVDMGGVCGQACRSRQGCQECAQEYSDSARETLQSEALQVASLFERDFSHDTLLPSIIRDSDINQVQINYDFEMDRDFNSRLETMATQYADRVTHFGSSDIHILPVDVIRPDILVRDDMI